MSILTRPEIIKLGQKSRDRIISLRMDYLRSYSEEGSPEEISEIVKKLEKEEDKLTKLSKVILSMSGTSVIVTETEIEYTKSSRTFSSFNFFNEDQTTVEILKSMEFIF